MIEEGLRGDERVFRSINSEDVVIVSAGWRLSSTAFNDAGQKPSVDRAAVRPMPKDARLTDACGVAELLTKEVRAINNVPVNPDASQDKQWMYSVDVYARPIEEGNPAGDPENLAHAQIETAPDFKSRNHFKKLKDRLARLAEKRGLLIVPAGMSVTGRPLAQNNC